MNSVFLSSSSSSSSRTRRFSGNRTSGINEGVSFEDSLSGLSLNVQAWYAMSDPYMVDYDDATASFSGVLYELLESISSRAGFSYTLTLRNSSDPANNRSYVENVEYMARHYDVSLHATTQTESRAAIGLMQPYGIFDLSPWFVTKTKNEPDNPFKNRNAFFAFASPLSWDVWFCLVASAIFTGFVYRFLERKVETTDAHSIGEATYLSMLHVAGAGALEPTTLPGKILALSWGFLVLIVVASYTANLAAVLVEESSSTAVYASIDDAIEAGAKICVHQGYATETFLDTWYPAANKVPTDAMWADMDDGKCQGVLTDYLEFQVAEVNSDRTASCRITKVDQALATYYGGWMVLADYNEKCSALVSDVLAIHFLRLEASDTLAEVVQKYLDLQTNKQCDDDDDDSNQVDDDTLTISDLAGIFVLHGWVVALSILAYLFLHWKNRVMYELSLASSSGESVADFLGHEDPNLTQISTETPGRNAPIKNLVAVSNREVKRLSGDVARVASRIKTIETRLDAKLDHLLSTLGVLDSPPSSSSTAPGVVESPLRTPRTPPVSAAETELAQPTSDAQTQHMAPYDFGIDLPTLFSPTRKP